jgi:dihydrofolate synthase / folylpolyglutamate synthase
LQMIQRGANQKLLLDGAHNVGSAEALRATLKIHLRIPGPTLVMGILRDKDSGPMCEILAPLAGRILLVPVNSQRTASPEELVPVCRKANPGIEIKEIASLNAALAETANDPFVVITGSLYLIGEAMELLDLSPNKVGGERNLNEWNATGFSSIVSSKP